MAFARLGNNRFAEGLKPPRRARRRKAATSSRRFGRLTALGLGALVMYLFDPQLGRTRRSKLMDQLAGRVRSGVDAAEKKSRYFGGRAEGVLQEMSGRGAGQTPPNDAALAHKVESEVLSRFNYPKGKVVVDAAGGVVALRGELDTPEQISELEQEVRKVTGVVDVENFLHLPGQEPPNKEAAIDAST